MQSKLHGKSADRGRSTSDFHDDVDSFAVVGCHEALSLLRCPTSVPLPVKRANVLTMSEANFRASSCFFQQFTATQR